MSTFFVISSQPRTGTHLLSSSITSHLEATSEGELFNVADPGPWRLPEAPASFLRKWISKVGAAKAFGFAIHHRDLCRPGVANAIIFHRPRVILLHRLQLLEQLCSHEVASKTRVWSVPKEAERPASLPTITVTPASAANQLERFVKSTDADRELWRRANCPILDITYEYLCKEYAAAMDVVQDFLGLERGVLKSWTAKQESRVPREIITNYAELAEAMRQTKWAYLFPEQTPERSNDPPD